MKRLLILSGKGGTGKTTTAAAFIRFSQTKAIADCDVDAPNLHLVYEQTVKPTVSDFYGGDKAVIDWDRLDSAYVSAIIELKVTPNAGLGFEDGAAKVMKYPEVESVYLM